MKKALLVILLPSSMALAQACSGDDSAGGGSGVPDASTNDAATQPETSAPDATSDTGTGSDGSDDGGCPAAWFVAPVTAPSIAVPDGGEPVLLHATGTGTQDYACLASDDAGTTTYTWTLTGPEANLTDCHATLIGHHFASEAGATRPEWQTTDGTDVIGKKLFMYSPPDAAAVPWLLLQEVSTDGTGVLSHADYIQRLNTDGGLAPASTCDGSNVGAVMKTPYTADYYFFGE
jgi:Protein of unknown function (DUF3455)